MSDQPKACCKSCDYNTPAFEQHCKVCKEHDFGGHSHKPREVEKLRARVAELEEFVKRAAKIPLCVHHYIGREARKLLKKGEANETV